MSQIASLPTACCLSGASRGTTGSRVVAHRRLIVVVRPRGPSMFCSTRLEEGVAGGSPATTTETAYRAFLATTMARPAFSASGA